MAQAPRPGAGRRAEAEATTITIKVDDETYTVRPSELNAKLAGQLRKESSMSVRSVMVAAGEDPDLDVIAALVWLARRQRGEDVSWDEVAEAISYDSDFGATDEPEPEDADSPEV